MNLREFIIKVCASEKKATDYLRDVGVTSTEMVCPEERCGKTMKSDLKRGRWRCFNSIYRKEFPMRGENEFFSYKREVVDGTRDYY